MALVTGSAQGIGQALAVGLAHYGATVVATDLDGDRLGATANLLGELGQPHLTCRLDVVDRARIDEVIALVVDRFGRIDVLVNNAGIRIPKPTLQTSDEEWDRVMAVNLRATFILCRQVGRHLVERRAGCIVNVASQLGHVGLGERAAYCASKAGIVNLVRSLAIEWAPYNVRVNALCPGPIRTPYHDTPETRHHQAAVVAKVPLGRAGEVEELIGATVFLASDASSFVTGASIVVDGGYLAQ
ncbi:MAG: SDR family oxidoreductase [Chloroflexi bacterium]|nr:SDR family oxidoreductase [Chloroflexota bacterium]